MCSILLSRAYTYYSLDDVWIIDKGARSGYTSAANSVRDE